MRAIKPASFCDLFKFSNSASLLVSCLFHTFCGIVSLFLLSKVTIYGICRTRTFQVPCSLDARCPNLFWYPDLKPKNWRRKMIILVFPLLGLDFVLWPTSEPKRAASRLIGAVQCSDYKDIAVQCGTDIRHVRILFKIRAKPGVSSRFTGAVYCVVGNRYLVTVQLYQRLYTGVVAHHWWAQSAQSEVISAKTGFPASSNVDSAQFSVVNCPTRWSLYCHLAFCFDHHNPYLREI